MFCAITEHDDRSPPGVASPREKWGQQRRHRLLTAECFLNVAESIRETALRHLPPMAKAFFRNIIFKKSIHPMLRSRDECSQILYWPQFISQGEVVPLVWAPGRAVLQSGAGLRQPRVPVEDHDSRRNLVEQCRPRYRGRCRSSRRSSPRL